MAKKKSADKYGFVYSTDPQFRFTYETETPQTLSKEQQRLTVRIDTRHRAGKAVTLVEGFTGTNEDLERLGKELKAFCGCGGSVKEGVILIQGDHREKVFQWLLKNGYSKVKKN
ncbi:MAG: translation initiation factor [Chitinophagaceae bacterium]|nr:translation initiation factor [Chitinophagaceae bacterium]